MHIILIVSALVVLYASVKGLLDDCKDDIDKAHDWQKKYK
jgi:hypothetical protein